MTDDTSTTDGTAAPDAAQPAPRTRRRAATRPAGPPAADGADSGVAAAERPADPATEPSPPAAKRTRAARTTKATKAAKAAPAAEQPDGGAETSGSETTASTTSGASADADTPAPAKRAARKRAAKKTAPAAAASQAADDRADTSGTTEATDPTAAAAASSRAGGPAADAEPPVKATRKRASRARKTAAPADQPALPGAADDAPSTTLSAVGVPVVRGAAPATGADLDDAESSDRGGVGAAAVLFQAPDPTAAAPRRRRRAQAPAGPARTPEDGDEVEPVTDAGTAAGDTQAESAQPESTDADGHEAESDDEQGGGRKRRRRGGRGRRRRGEGDQQDAGQQGEDQNGDSSGRATSDDEGGSGAQQQDVGGESDDHDHDQHDDHDDEGSSSSRRRRRRRRRSGGDGNGNDDPPGTVTKVRQSRKNHDEVASVKGSTRLEAKKQRRRDGREAGRRKQIITESEFLARRESVERTMIVRERSGRTQIAVLEDDVLVEHYVANETNTSMIGNVYLGRVQNVLPSMEAAFVDIGKGRNAVLYAGEVNWDAAGLEGQPRRIEQALKSGDTVLVQVTKDPLGHKGARLTSQVSLPGRYLVYVPNSSMTGISRKLPDTERSRLKKILKAVVPDHAGVIVRTAAEGASEEELQRDVTRLTAQWEDIQKKAGSSSGGAAPKLLHGEPDLTIRVVRDVFNEDFAKLVVSGAGAWDVVQPYLQQVAPDLAERASRWTAEEDVFVAHRVDEQLAKAMDRKVYLPSGGSLVIDRTEAMTVVDVNTGKFTGSGGNLEETVTRNNLEAAEEIVRQLRLRDIGGIIVVDFIDMVLESNRDLVLRRLVECLGRDRTKHQVAEVTSLGLVQMTRKRVGQGLLEVFSEPCEHCHGRGVLIHSEPVSKNGSGNGGNGSGSGNGSGTGSGRSRRGKGGSSSSGASTAGASSPTPAQPPRGPIPAGLVASLARHAEHHDEHHDEHHEGHHREDRHEGDGRDDHRQDDQPSVETQQSGPAGRPEPAPSGEAAVAQLSASSTEDAGQPVAAADAVVVEAPVEQAPVEQAPVEQAPVEQAPVEQAPAVKPRRRRRAASAPAGPPAKHGAGDEQPSGASAGS